MKNRDFQKEIKIDMALSESFGDKLIRLMNAYPKTIEDMAESIGVSEETIGRYRRNAIAPDIRMAVAMCLAFSLDLEQSETFLNSLAYTLLEGSSRETRAYRKLIKEYPGIPVEQANRILASWGLSRRQQLYPRKRK